MIRLILSFLLCFSLAYFILDKTDGLVAPVFAETLTIFLVVATIAVSMTFALHRYIDSITKEVADHKDKFDKEKYTTAMTKLDNLRKEILVNVFAIGLLLVLERIAFGGSLIFSDDSNAGMTQMLFLSFRFGCVGTAVVTASIQLHGFVIASEFRSILSRV